MSELKPAWPHVDWTLLHDDQDLLAPTEYRPDLVEEVCIVRQRANAFLNFLAERPEDFIIVVAHAGFIRCALAEVLGLDRTMSPPEPSTGQNVTVEFVNNQWHHDGPVKASLIPPRKGTPTGTSTP